MPLSAHEANSGLREIFCQGRSEKVSLIWELLNFSEFCCYGLKME